MITFTISTGDLSTETGSIGSGYAGAGAPPDGSPSAVNDPTRCSEHNVGPLPPGWYAIGAPEDGGPTGDYSMPLTPIEVPKLFGRGHFRFHGGLRGEKDTSPAVDPGGDRLASEGCVVAGHVIRHAVWDGGHRLIHVVP